MTATDVPQPQSESTGTSRLAFLLAMAMFVLVVDTSFMNVSISAVVQDLGTTVSGVQSAIALEALVSAAFILIGGKIGDLFGRKRAYVLGLLGYAVGGVAMTVAQSLTALIVFWSIIGGIGAALLLPAMQSLIHGNFDGAERTKVYALVGASAAIATAVGPLLGGFITTYLSWRVAFGLEVVVIAVVLSGIKLVQRREVHGAARHRPGRRAAVGGRHGRRRARNPRVAGGRRVRRRADHLRGARARRSRPLAAAAQARGQAGAARHRAVQVPVLPARRDPADDAADRARRLDHRPAHLSADGARVQRVGGRAVARAAVAEHVRDGAAGGAPGRAIGGPPRSCAPASRSWPSACSC